MRPRVVLAHFLVRLGGFIQSLAVVVMRPDDLVFLNRQFYSKPKELLFWGEEGCVDLGLNPLETSLLEKAPVKMGRLPLLGIGGGREAIPLARSGYQVTGVDFIPEMAAKAQENAARQGLNIEGIIQEVSVLNVAKGSFDLVWLSSGMYSSIPTRRSRVEMLRRIYGALKPGGYFICTFYWDKKVAASPKIELAKKIFGFLTVGNLWYEPGDKLWPDKEFLHAFSSEADIISEYSEAGFKVLNLQIPESGFEGGALLAR